LFGGGENTAGGSDHVANSIKQSDDGAQACERFDADLTKVHGLHRLAGTAQQLRQLQNHLFGQSTGKKRKWQQRDFESSLDDSSKVVELTSRQ
jgi:hypothetical protein